MVAMVDTVKPRGLPDMPMNDGAMVECVWKYIRLYSKSNIKDSAQCTTRGNVVEWLKRYRVRQSGERRNLAPRGDLGRYLNTFSNRDENGKEMHRGAKK